MRKKKNSKRTGKKGGEGGVGVFLGIHTYPFLNLQPLPSSPAPLHIVIPKFSSTS